MLLYLLAGQGAWLCPGSLGAVCLAAVGQSSVWSVKWLLTLESLLHVVRGLIQSVSGAYRCRMVAGYLAHRCYQALGLWQWYSVDTVANGILIVSVDNLVASNDLSCYDNIVSTSSSTAWSIAWSNIVHSIYIQTASPVWCVSSDDKVAHLKYKNCVTK